MTYLTSYELNRIEKKYFYSIAILSLFLVSNCVMALTDIGNTKLSCGQVVHANVTLTGNLLCSREDGLIVGEDNTVINLNGYSINGPGPNSAKVGISVPHDNNVTINGPGKIRNFQAGILISGSQNTDVNRITFEGNKIAVFTTVSMGSIVEENLIRQNTIGIAFHSSIESQLKANNLTDNDLAGVTFNNTDNSRVNANSIGKSRNGIYLDEDSSKNTILNNTAMKNDIDINNADGLAVSENGNEFNNNKCNTSDPESICRK